MVLKPRAYSRCQVSLFGLGGKHAAACGWANRNTQSDPRRSTQVNTLATNRSNHLLLRYLSSPANEGKANGSGSTRAPVEVWQRVSLTVVVP